MSEEKKVNKAEEVKTEENGVQLTDEQMAQAAGGIKLDPDRLRRKIEEQYPT